MSTKPNLSSSTVSRVLGVLVAIWLSVFASASPAADLVVDTVDSTKRTVLPQERLAWATAANDMGEVADTAQSMRLTIILKRTPERQRAFDELLVRQQDPASSDFHHWLTPEEVGDQFGASSHDIAALTGWLEAQGLKVDAVANSRVRINAAGSPAAVGAAFSTRIHAYLVKGEQRIAPDGTAAIPAALSSIVQSVHGLFTVTDSSYGGGATAQQSSERALDATPKGTFCSGSSCTHYVFPADFAAIYGINPVYQQGIDGAGQTIAIVGRARVYLPDIENFQSRSALAIKDPVIVVPPNGIDPGAAVATGGTTPNDQLEATIDVTRATSVAPGATVELVISSSTSTLSGIAVASEYIIDSTTVRAQIMNISFGACEAHAGKSGVDLYDSLFSQAAAEGISVFVSSGDSGAAGCDDYNAAVPATQTLSPNYICASSHATCVGGTQFADLASPSSFWSASNRTGGVSALGYIPEGAWNEPLDSQGRTQASATGGGVSTFITAPAWQVGVATPGTLGRATPDVSFSASRHDGYFACLASAGNSCVSNTAGAYSFEYLYGTSAASPDMAGVAALLNQKMGAAQGTLNARLYALATTPANGVYHDVTIANSGVSGCDVNVPSMCNNSTPAPGGLTGGLAGYVVSPGYDLATGLGSINVANLLANWTSVPSTINYEGLWWNAPAAPNRDGDQLRASG